MAIIGFLASRSIPGGMDIHAGIPEEGDPSREQWQEDDEPRIAHQSTSAAPTSLPVMTAPSTSATISTPPTASTATASIIVRGCQCSQDLVELEREKVALLRDVCGLLRESADYQKEVIVLKRAKLDIMACRLALEEETRSSERIRNKLPIFSIIMWLLLARLGLVLGQLVSPRRVCIWPLTLLLTLIPGYGGDCPDDKRCHCHRRGYTAQKEKRSPKDKRCT
ncbi:unnamed protein product [Gadus morhua 'NCC']